MLCISKAPLHTAAAPERTSGWVHIWQHLLSPPYCQRGEPQIRTSSCTETEGITQSAQDRRSGTLPSALKLKKKIYTARGRERNPKSRRLERVTCCTTADPSTAWINRRVTAKLLTSPVSPQGAVQLHSAGGLRQPHELTGSVQPSVRCWGRKRAFPKTLRRTGQAVSSPNQPQQQEVKWFWSWKQKM